jgi:GNAT superfamily N-acetyltransferase
MVTIGELAKEDAAEAARATRECMEDAWERWMKDYYTKEAMESDQARHSAEEYRRRTELPDSFILTAKEDGGIVGVSTGEIELEGGVARLTWMGVARDSRGHGIGNQMLESVEDHVRNKGCHKIYVVTLPCLTDAVRLYFKRGWVPECNLTRHLWKADFMVMSKWFD